MIRQKGIASSTELANEVYAVDPMGNLRSTTFGGARLREQAEGTHHCDSVTAALIRIDSAPGSYNPTPLVSDFDTAGNQIKATRSRWSEDINATLFLGYRLGVDIRNHTQYAYDDLGRLRRVNERAQAHSG